MDNEDNVKIVEGSTPTQDEKLVELNDPQLNIPDEDTSKKPSKSKEKKSKKDEDKGDPYKNMAARKIILIIGFILCTIGFGLMVFSLVTLLIPNDFATIQLFIPFNIASCAASFVGIIFAVAGANTAKGLARLSFLFAILGFILSAGMLVVMLITQLLPFEAIANILKG